MLEKIRKIGENTYKVIAYIAIIAVILLINYDHIIMTDNKLQTLKIILWSIIGISLMVAFNKLVVNKLKEKNLWKITLAGLGIFLVLEIISTIYFKVEYNWDFKWLMESALEFAQTGKIEDIYYFKRFPNNIGALLIVTTAMKLFNTNVLGAYVINIIFIFLAALFTVLVARKMGGERLAINTIILLLGFMPMYLNSPIVYTDSLSIVFPVAILYFWMLAKENKERSKKKYYSYLIIMAILSVIAYFIKANAVIVLIAIIIDGIFCKKHILKPLALILVIFVVLMTLGNTYIEKFVIEDKRKNEFEFPLTHWVMLGLGLPESEGGTSIGYGAYSQDDADFTAVRQTYQEKKDGNIQVIKQRLKDFGVTGYIKFLFKKFNYVWNDGTYYVLNVIGWDTINTDSTLYRLVLGEQSYQFVRPYMTYFNDMIFILILYLIIKDIKNKQRDEIIRIIGISIVGIAIFLLIWEARSRYIYLMIPLFCILAAKGIYELSNNIKKLEKGK